AAQRPSSLTWLRSSLPNGSATLSGHAALPLRMTEPTQNHFIRQIVINDRAAGKNDGRVATRFPPEPNGYLHLGHAKSICLNFGLAREFGGNCDLRYDDTNPAKEEQEYVDAIQNDVRWLGFEWDNLRHTSDYFEVLYLCAEKLIRDGHA